MFGTLGGPEVILILVIALIVFGPRKLPEIGKSMGKMLAEFRKASNDFKRTIEDELEAEKQKEPAPPAASTLPPATSAEAAPGGLDVPEAKSYGYDGSLTTATPETATATTGAVTPLPGPPETGGAPAAAAPEPRVDAPGEPTVSRGSADER
jgi:TatA/E family protein of Tat protein translocase